jgi:hypothetical protein
MENKEAEGTLAAGDGLKAKMEDAKEAKPSAEVELVVVRGTG